MELVAARAYSVGALHSPGSGARWNEYNSAEVIVITMPGIDMAECAWILGRHQVTVS